MKWCKANVPIYVTELEKVIEQGRDALHNPQQPIAP